MFIIFAVLLILGIFYFLLNKEKKNIKVVAVATMRGIEAGVDTVNGIKLAFKENDYLLDGYNIELIVEDNGDEEGYWVEDVERNIAIKASEDQDAMVYIGPIDSGAAKISIPITNKFGLPQISPTNTWPGLTKAGFAPGEPGIFYPTGVRNYFRVCPTDDIQGPAGVIWAKEMGFENIFVFDDGSLYGIGISNIFEEKAINLGLNILGRETLNRESQDYTSKLNEIKKLNIDLIYFGGVMSNGLVSLLKGIKELDLQTKFMGTDGIMDQAVIAQAGESAEGIYLTTIGIPVDKLQGEEEIFYENYLNEYKIEPSAYSAFGYESAKVIIFAISKTKKINRNEILNQLSNLQNYSGVFGNWSFDSSGDTSLILVSGNIVKNGKFEYEKTLSSW